VRGSDKRRTAITKSVHSNRGGAGWILPKGRERLADRKEGFGCRGRGEEGLSRKNEKT